MRCSALKRQLLDSLGEAQCTLRLRLRLRLRLGFPFGSATAQIDRAQVDGSTSREQQRSDDRPLTEHAQHCQVRAINSSLRLGFGRNGSDSLHALISALRCSGAQTNTARVVLGIASVPLRHRCMPTPGLRQLGRTTTYCRRLSARTATCARSTRSRMLSSGAVRGGKPHTQCRTKWQAQDLGLASVVPMRPMHAVDVDMGL